jgi:hypothetical protein
MDALQGLSERKASRSTSIGRRKDAQVRQQTAKHVAGSPSQHLMRADAARGPESASSAGLP